MTERRKLSLGNVADRAASADKTRGWKVSPARAAALKERAREMRRHPSLAQAALWERLKDKQCAGFSFSREVVMGSAIVDFACKSRWLVVETGAADGADATIAELSDRKLAEVGVRVLRFSDERIASELDSVVAEIEEELRQPWERPRIQAPSSERYAR